METQYFCFFNSYMEKFGDLTDEQLGRVVRAASLFNATGQETEFTGAEAIAFASIRYDIKGAKDRYAKRCETNSRNRRKALERQENNDGQQSSTVVEKNDDRQRSSTKTTIVNENDDRQRSSKKSTIVKKNDESDQSKTKSKSKTKTKEKEIPLSPKKGEAGRPDADVPAPPASPKDDLTIPESWNPILRDAVDSWLRYKCERREPYKPVGLRTLFARIEEKAETYGPLAVAEAIRDSISSGYKGILWDRLQKTPEPKKQSYTQSDYAGGEDFLADIGRRDSG